MKPAELDAARLEYVRAQLREQYPALQSGGWTMLENAGGTLVPKMVVDAVAHHYNTIHCHVGGVYEQSKAVGRLWEAEERFVDSYMNCGPDGRAAIGVSARALLHVLAGAVFDRLAMDAAKGRKVAVHLVVAAHNHMTHSDPWKRFHQRAQALSPKMHCTYQELTRADASSSGFLSAAELREKLEKAYGSAENEGREVVAVVAVPHVSNLIGEVADVEALIRVVREFRGARICVDGVAFGSSGLIDCAKWRPDFYTMSLYKICTPQHGALYASNATWRWLFETGLDARSFNSLAGRSNFTSSSGVLAYERYLAKVVSLAEEMTEGDALRLPQRELICRALRVVQALSAVPAKAAREGIAAMRGVTLVRSGAAFGPHTKPITSFTTQTCRPAEVAEALARHGIAAKAGTLMSCGAARILGIPEEAGVVRLSPAHYNTAEEIRAALRVISDVVSGKSKL